MRKPWRKIALALLLSFSSFAATHFTYLATAPSLGISADREPIAFVSLIKNEVGRRPIKRTIWQELDRGEPVFAGEAIRTSSNAEAHLKFVGGERSLELEPDSLIVLSKSQDKISLELLDGNIFVAGSSTGTDSSSLTLKSESGDVDLSRATASLSKDGGAVAVQVLKGQAQVLSGTGASLDSSELEILSPKMDSPIFVSSEVPSEQIFKWKTSLENSGAQLWVGTSRKQLQPIPNSQFKKDQIAHTLKSGKYFWKLQFKNTAGELSDSPIYRLDIRSLAAPLILQPSKGELVKIDSETTPTKFIWSTGEGTTESTLEIARDVRFRQIFFTEKYPQGQNQVERILPAGKYYWRVSTYYPEQHQVIAGAPQSFDIWVKPPKIINITWNPAKTLYYPLDPSANIQWQATEDPDIKKWRVKFAASEENMKFGDFHMVESETKSAATNLPQAGRWIASIEALDKDEKVLSTSEPRDFEIEPLPLIPAPTLLPQKGIFKASASGQLDLTWKSSDKARSHTIRILSGTGEAIATETSTGAKLSFADLMPGSYKIEIFATDEYGRRSQQLPPRSVIVPDNSGLSAPKVKKVKVN